jgi:hypothetical protein
MTATPTSSSWPTRSTASLALLVAKRLTAHQRRERSNKKKANSHSLLSRTIVAVVTVQQQRHYIERSMNMKIIQSLFILVVVDVECSIQCSRQRMVDVMLFGVNYGGCRRGK